MSKKSLVITSICILGISVSSAAVAQSDSGNSISEKRAEFAARMMERLDANSDGSISQEEFMAIVEERFTAADLDQDGTLTKDEARNASRTQRADRMIERLDTDGDGKVSLSEAQAAANERAAERFSRADADEDGFITADEIESRMGQRGRGHRAAHRGGGMRSLFRADRNRDGEVTLVEIQAARETRFDTLDANNDGLIEVDEIVERVEMGQGRRGHGKKGRGGRDRN